MERARGNQFRRRILIVITRSVLGGAQTYVYNLATNLPEDRYEVTVACQGAGPLVTALDHRGIRVTELRYMRNEIRLTRDLLAVAELVSLIREIKPDLIHLNSSKAGFLGRIAAAVCGIPAVYFVHGWAFRQNATATFRPIAIWAERLAAPLCSRFISPSRHEIEIGRQFRIGRMSRCVCIPHGIKADAPRANPAGWNQDGSVTACMVARFERPKRQELLILAAKQVPSVRLVLVGDGDRRASCETLVRRLGMADRVDFLGNRLDVADILAKAHMGIMSTDMESLPIALLEAMRAGLPVLGTQTGGVPEVIEHGVNGFMGPTGDSEWMAEAFSRLAGDPKRRENMGAASRVLFEKKFTLERMVQQTLEVYDSVISERLGRLVR